MNLGYHAPIRATVSGKQLLAQTRGQVQQFPCCNSAYYISPTSSGAVPSQATQHWVPKSPTRRASRTQYVPGSSSVKNAWSITQSSIRPTACSIESSKQELARVFMLQCRSRSLLGKPRQNFQRTAFYVRHYSNLAEVVSDSVPNSIDENETEKSKIPAYADASMVEGEGNLPKLQMRLVKSCAPKTLRTEANDISVIHEIEVSETTSISRAVRTEFGVIKGEKIRRAIELQIREEGTPVTWLQVLQRLERHTPAQRQAHQTTLVVRGPRLELVELYHTLLSDPTYDIKVDYPVTAGCHGSMLIGGTEDQVKDVANLVEESSAWQCLGIGYGQTSARKSRIKQTEAMCTSPKSSSPLDRITRPTAWTKKSFAEFVQSVTNSRPPHILRKGVPHKDIVESILVELIYNAPNLRSHLSWDALHQALSFLVKHQKTHAAKDLLGHMERNGYTPSAETFNIFLHACASEQNMSAFNHFLSLMLNEGVMPNEGSWVALMLAAPSIEAQKTIAREMFARGFAVKPTFARENAPQIVPYSFGPFLDAGGTVADFVKALDSLYGPHWVHAAAVNEIITTLAARGRFISAIGLLQDLNQSRDYTPTSDNVHILLRHCARHANLDLAIWLVIYFHRTWRTNTDDHIILARLFDIAWKSRTFNVLRVVWKYTNAAGEATFDMRRRVNIGLWERIKSSPDTVLGRWKSSFGCVACGVDPLAVGSGTPEGILEAEKRLYGRKAIFPFTYKLVEALCMDKEWTTDRVKKTRGVTWKVRNAIQVPFEPVVPVLRKVLGLQTGNERRQGRIRRFVRHGKSGILYEKKTRVEKVVDST